MIIHEGKRTIALEEADRLGYWAIVIVEEAPSGMMRVVRKFSGRLGE